MIKNLLGPLWVKVTVATAAIVLSFGGAAFAGVLPAPLQDVVAPPAQQIGLPVPDSTGQVAATAVDSDDQGENADEASVVETPDVEADDVEDADAADEQSADESDTPEAVDVEAADDQGDDADEQKAPEHVKAQQSDSGDSNDSGNGDN